MVKFLLLGDRVEMSGTRLILLKQIVEDGNLGKPEWASPKHLLRGGNFECSSYGGNVGDIRAWL